MTTLPPASNRRWTLGGNRLLSRQFLFILCLGGGIGTLVALALYATNATYVGILLLGLALVLSTVFAKNHRLYWFAIFLLSLQFTISNNLNEGLEELKSDYTIQNFTFKLPRPTWCFWFFSLSGPTTACSIGNQCTCRVVRRWISWHSPTVHCGSRVSLSRHRRDIAAEQSRRKGRSWL